MRIISGLYKGRSIPVHKSFKARPTTDFAKENIFNILNNHFYFDQCKALDLFSGTGSISYEFASRGCISVTSVEKDFRSFDFIKKTAKFLELNMLKAIKADAFNFIKKCPEQFDIIFADPPYELNILHTIPDAVMDGNLLKDNGWFILEHGKTHKFNDNQFIIDTRIYGSVHFSIFSRK